MVGIGDILVLNTFCFELYKFTASLNLLRRASTCNLCSLSFPLTKAVSL